jgi:hypothetical protein
MFKLLQRLLSGRRSGVVVATGITLVALVLVLAGYGLGLGWADSWRLFGVPSQGPAFLDLHAVTDNVACAAHGINVYIYMDCDVLHRGYNYPPIWLLLGQLGIGSRDTAWLGLAIALPSLALIVALLSGRSVGKGLLGLLVVLSPSVMLAFERGNIDLVEWSLVCAAALTFSDRRWPRAALSLALLIFAVLLKLIAAFCCALMVRPRRLAVLLSCTLFVFSLAYIYYGIVDVYPMVRNNTNRDFAISFGYMPVFGQIESLLAPSIGVRLPGLASSSTPLLTALGVVAIAGAWAVRRTRRNSRWCKIGDATAGTAFIFGAGVYVGCFLFLQTNYAYRLIFLLLCLPQLFDWIDESGIEPGVRGISTDRRGSGEMGRLLLCSCMLTVWLTLIPYEMTLGRWSLNLVGLHLLAQLADWTLFGAFTAIFAANGYYALAPKVASVASLPSAE